MSDAAKSSRILTRGLLAGVVMFAVGVMFHWLVPVFAPAIAGVYGKPPFRPWPGWTMYYMIAHPFWFGFGFAWLFTFSRAAHTSSRHGARFGAVLFLVGALPVYLLILASVAIPPQVILCWLLQGFSQYVLAGVVLALGRPSRLPSNLDLGSDHFRGHPEAGQSPDDDHTALLERRHQAMPAPLAQESSSQDTKAAKDLAEPRSRTQKPQGHRLLHGCPLAAAMPRLAGRAGRDTDRSRLAMVEIVQDIETTYGRIRGSRHGGFCLFRGVPFARPPIGGQRFRPPEPPEAWSGSRDATCFGPPAPQNCDPLDHIWGEILAPGDEDCLTLNVWTPAADGARRPVMVCIHGGAFVIGSGRWPWYDGRALVRRSDVVLVTINYRLGALGFLDLSELGGAEYATSGNHGLLDQVAALRWVRDNIEQFGGDPANVTVFGESAGGISISCLLAMPSARGLFRRAIVMSGGPNLVRFPGTSRAVARAFLRTAGVRDVDGLRVLPTKALLKAQKRLLRRNEFGGDLVFGPLVDGSVLPDPPLHAIRAGCARDVALLVGTTLDEARLWSLYVPILRWTRPHALERVLRHTIGERWRALIAAYRRSRTGDKAGNLTMAINGDLLFWMPAVRLAEAQSAHRPDDTRMYLFAWRTPICGGRLGAPHAVDVPFVFGNLHAPGVELYTDNGADRKGLSDLVQGAWIAFARSGDPNHPDLTAWPAYGAEARATLVFDGTTRVENDPMADERLSWADVPFDGLNPAIECCVPSTRDILASFLTGCTSRCE